MKTPDGGGKKPGMQKSGGFFKQPRKPEEKVRPVHEKPDYTPAPKPQHQGEQSLKDQYRKEHYRQEQKPMYKAGEQPLQKPQRDADHKKRLALLDRFKNRQGQSEADISSAESSSTASTGGGRRSCCLGCAVYAMTVPALVLLVLFSVI